MEKHTEYINFQVAPYALPKVCEALYRNGVRDFCVTQEDEELHIRWKYDVNRFNPKPKIYASEPAEIPYMN